MNRKNTRLRLSLLMLLGAIGLAGCSSEQTSTTPPPETVRNLAIVVVQQANVPDLLEAVGTVRAAQTSEAASQMMGNIVEIRAHEGDPVRRGQVLAVIDDSQPRAAADRATAADACCPTATGRSRFRLGPGGIDLEALPDSLRKEIGESAGVR